MWPRSSLPLLLLFATASFPLSAERIRLTVLATTDMHGNMYPLDYYNDDKPANRGLVKIATLIRAARADNPNNLLVDCGDTRIAVGNAERTHENVEADVGRILDGGAIPVSIGDACSDPNSSCCRCWKASTRERRPTRADVGTAG